MGLFGPAKGSIKETIRDKAKAGQPYGSGAATQVQARKAKARKEELKEEKKRKKQEARDIARYNLLRTPKTDPAKQRKNKKKALAAAEKRRAKKAERKARGFWG